MPSRLTSMFSSAVGCHVLSTHDISVQALSRNIQVENVAEINAVQNGGHIVAS